jgi:hypothetical protein
MSEVALSCFWIGCSGSLGSSMKVDGEWPRLAADPVWWTIERFRIVRSLKSIWILVISYGDGSGKRVLSQRQGLS